MTAQIEAFDRQQISSVLRIPYAVVKNWSTGRPLSIEPSIHAPSQRGKQSLYSREDVYRFALAQTWAVSGLNYDAIATLLTLIKREWFSPNTRGTLLVLQISNKPRLHHFPRNSEIEAVRHAENLLESDSHDGDAFYLFRLGHMLDKIDEKIEKLKGHRDNEKKSK